MEETSVGFFYFFGKVILGCIYVCRLCKTCLNIGPRRSERAISQCKTTNKRSQSKNRLFHRKETFTYPKVVICKTFIKNMDERGWTALTFLIPSKTVFYNVWSRHLPWQI